MIHRGDLIIRFLIIVYVLKFIFMMMNSQWNPLLWLKRRWTKIVGSDFVHMWHQPNAMGCCLNSQDRRLDRNWRTPASAAHVNFGLARVSNDPVSMPWCTRIGPQSDRCWKHRSDSGRLLVHHGLFTGKEWIHILPELLFTCRFVASDEAGVLLVRIKVIHL